jgi:hypothetical protein
MRFFVKHLLNLAGFEKYNGFPRQYPAIPGSFY